MRRLRELKEMQELTVKEDEKYVKEPLDPKLFEWNSKVIYISLFLDEYKGLLKLMPNRNMEETKQSVP